mmetsp:Transcript_8092/g.12112  ORF Transcript_8092/g.12112 Transcript_8092/m.12112 type:complete len:122 (-) Transcript_8092:1009-1374(-)
MVDDNDRKGAKRQKMLSEQRSAYEEDMARINAELNEQPQTSSAAADGEEKKNENSGDTQQHQQHQQQQGGHESDDEEGGNWLKNFTPHHTRVGENFQVTDLPTPSATTSHSTSAAVIVPKQ